MALTKQELRADASKMYDEAEAILTSEAPSAEEVAKATELQAKAEAQEARAASLEAIETRKAALGASAVTRPATAKSEDRSADETVEVREAKLFRDYLNTGDKAALRDAAPQSTLTAPQGGVFVPTTLSNQVIEVIAAQAPMLSGKVGFIWKSGSGNDFDIPRGDDRAGLAYEVAEAANHPDTDFQFDKVRFGAHEYGTGIVAITEQMKRDGTYDLNGYVTRQFGVRLARLLNDRLTNGNGTTQPEGLISGLKTASRIVEAVSETDLTFADLMSAEEELDEAYLATSSYMLSRKTLNKLRLLKATDGAPVVFQGNYAQGAPATILGRNYVINNLLADGEVALGDFGQTQWVRQVGDLAIKTSSEVYFRRNMEGVAGFASYDAKIVNPYASILLTLNAG